MTEKKASRFDGLFGAVKATRATESGNLDVQTSKRLDVQLSKSKDPSYQRTTIYIPKTMHRKLKAIAAEEGQEISAIIEELIQQWLESPDV